MMNRLDKRTVMMIEAAYAEGNNRIVCPVCSGGSDREECMSLWQSENGELMATCHRAHCWVGTIMVGKPGVQTKRRRPHKRSYIQSDYVQVTREMYRWLIDRYAFRFSQDIVMRYMRQVYNPHRPGLVIPMRDWSGAVRGIVVKPTSPEWSGPKSLTYKNEPEYSGMSWFTSAGDVTSEHVLVVEDCLSAIALKQASGCATVSLNGTVLNDHRIMELLQFKWRIVLMLDADATRKAIEYAQKYGPDVIRVVRLQHDIKDMTVEDVESLLEREEL